MASTSIFSELVRPRLLRPGWLLLYAATFALQLFCASVRYPVSYALLWLVLRFIHQPIGLAHTAALAAAYGPLGLSLAALVLPIGGWWWQQQAGGRSPSERERLLLDDALATLKGADPQLRGPRRWFVLDKPALNAAAYAETLMLTRGLLESQWLTAVLAHELGHLHTSDARLAAALGRMTTPPRQPLRGSYGLMRRLLRGVLFIATGELAVWVMRGPWGIYWRTREHQADQYAADLGQAEQLAEFLDLHALPWDLPIPFIWLTQASHPPTEHRIDRLYRHQPQAAPAAAGTKKEAA
jgi:Zn-dependent protease with chaperone function